MLLKFNMVGHGDVLIHIKLALKKGQLWHDKMINVSEPLDVKLLVLLSL